MKDILGKCERSDFDVFLKIAKLAKDDKERERILDAMEGSKSSKEEHIARIEDKMRYYASADIAYILRKMVGGGPPGVTSEVMVKDVCRKLKVKIKFGGSVETMLERLINAVVEKELSKKSPKDLEEIFKKGGIGIEQRELILESIRKNRAFILPILHKVLGPKITLRLIEAVIVSIIGQIIGREAAKALFREIIRRNPWIAAIGPWTWVISIGWLIYDLQGPAYRKTIPFCLYLGVVALRD